MITSYSDSQFICLFVRSVTTLRQLGLNGSNFQDLMGVSHPGDVIRKFGEDLFVH